MKEKSLIFNEVFSDNGEEQGCASRLKVKSLLNREDEFPGDLERVPLSWTSFEEPLSQTRTHG